MILLSCATISRTSRYDNIAVQTCLKNIMCLSGSYTLLHIWILIVLCCLVFLPSMTFAWVKLLLYCFSVCLSVLFPGLYQDFNNIFLFSYFIVSISHYDTELCKNDICMNWIPLLITRLRHVTTSWFHWVCGTWQFFCQGCTFVNYEDETTTPRTALFPGKKKSCLKLDSNPRPPCLG